MRAQGMQLAKLSIRHVELISLLMDSALKVGSLLLPMLLLQQGSAVQRLGKDIDGST